MIHVSFLDSNLIIYIRILQFSSVVSDSLQPHGLQHARLPCPSSTPRVYSNSCPSSRWCYPTISSFVAPFSSRLQSFPASGSFPVSPFFASGGQRIGVPASASVLPMTIQDWFLLGWTGWICLQSKGLNSLTAWAVEVKKLLTVTHCRLSTLRHWEFLQKDNSTF